MQQGGLSGTLSGVKMGNRWMPGPSEEIKTTSLLPHSWKRQCETNAELYFLGFFAFICDLEST